MATRYRWVKRFSDIECCWSFSALAAALRLKACPFLTVISAEKQRAHGQHLKRDQSAPGFGEALTACSGGRSGTRTGAGAHPRLPPRVGAAQPAAPHPAVPVLRLRDHGPAPTQRPSPCSAYSRAPAPSSAASGRHPSARPSSVHAFQGCVTRQCALPTARFLVGRFGSQLQPRPAADPTAGSPLCGSALRKPPGPTGRRGAWNCLAGRCARRSWGSCRRHPRACVAAYRQHYPAGQSQWLFLRSFPQRPGAAMRSQRCRPLAPGCCAPR
uniref:translation initiation factor IF-2-like n=1 Tax=Callithrix jacchus TaxID=9483 RepID=UPI0023DD2C77|nr:translation initiation factor IF-2-like [Callithrix jacchus]